MSQQHDFSTSVVTGETVGATTTAVLVANGARKYAVIINDSNEAIYIGLGVDAEMNKGIRLNANGGTLNLSGDRPFRGAVNAICASGGKNLCILEA